MTITIEHYKPQDVDIYLTSKLRPLTLEYGEMWPAFEKCISGKWKGHVVVATDDDTSKVIGWALRHKRKKLFGTEPKYWSVFLYVSPNQRKSGIGKQLITASRYRLRKTTILMGHPWDDRSNRFWSNLAKENNHIKIDRTYYY